MSFAVKTEMEHVSGAHVLIRPVTTQKRSDIVLKNNQNHDQVSNVVPLNMQPDGCGAGRLYYRIRG